MRKILKPLCVFVLSVSVLTLGACEPVSTTAPDLDAQLSVTRSNAQGAPRAWQRVTAQALDPDYDDGYFTTPGGTLNVGDNWLYVPQFAVMGPLTHFEMRSTGNFMDVELSATRNSPNDVGAEGLRRAVTLCLYYPASVGDRSNVRIAEFVANGD